MNPLVVLILTVLLVAVVQLLCCFFKYIPAKLIPVGLLAALIVWYCVRLNGAKGGPMMCGMGSAVLLPFFVIPAAGVVLGWMVYVIIWLLSGDEDDER